MNRFPSSVARAGGVLTAPRASTTQRLPASAAVGSLAVSLAVAALDVRWRVGFGWVRGRARRARRVGPGPRWIARPSPRLFELSGSGSGPGRGLALLLLGRLQLTPGDLRPLRRPAPLARLLQPAFGRPVESIPRTGTLLLRPEGPKPIEQEAAPGLEVDHQDLETAVGRPVRSPRGEGRIQIVCIAGAVANDGRVRIAKRGQMALHTGEHHIAVVKLAQGRLQVARPAPGDLRAATKAELRGLEHVAQPLGRDAHVVTGFDSLLPERLWRE